MACRATGLRWEGPKSSEPAFGEKLRAALRAKAARRVAGEREDLEVLGEPGAAAAELYQPLSALLVGEFDAQLSGGIG